MKRQRNRYGGTGKPGDNHEMIQSWKDFLNKGFYEEFSNRVTEVILSEVSISNFRTRNKEINFIDVRCDEGYIKDIYLEIKNKITSLGNLKEVDIYGIDILKPANHYASGRDRGISCAVPAYSGYLME
jgi:23S rRNA (guanine745-N1)-methyltransferase